MTVFKSRTAVLILSPPFQRRTWFLLVQCSLLLTPYLLASIPHFCLIPSLSAVILTMIFNLQPVRARHEKYFVILSLRLHFFIFCNLSLSDSAIHLSCSTLSLCRLLRVQKDQSNLLSSTSQCSVLVSISSSYLTPQCK